jgi:hypothetical protein
MNDKVRELVCDIHTKYPHAEVCIRYVDRIEVQLRLSDNHGIFSKRLARDDSKSVHAVLADVYQEARLERKESLASDLREAEDALMRKRAQASNAEERVNALRAELEASDV